MPVLTGGASYLSTANVYHSTKPDVPDSLRIRLLTEYLTTGCKSDSAKTYAIFRWITNHINYDVRAFHHLEDPYAALPETPAGLGEDAYQRWYNRETGTITLKRGKGVCDGYSRLFKAMCDNAGLETVCISGYARQEDRIGITFSHNHAWNAVKLGGSWKLLDATWASGYCDSGTLHYVRNYSPKYYLTLPEEFEQDHYPVDTSWLLMKEQPMLTTFFSEPLHHPTFLKDSIQDFSPANGLLAVAPEDVQVFSITGKHGLIIPMIFYEDMDGTLRAAPGQLPDLMQLVEIEKGVLNPRNGKWGLRKVQKTLMSRDSCETGTLERIKNYSIKDKTYTYNFRIPKDGVKYVRIYSDEGLLLTYRVSMRLRVLGRPLPPTSSLVK